MLKLAVIGRDVSKSASPAIHSFIAGGLKLDISYERVSVPEEEFADRIESLLNYYDGLNVTIPYKLSIIPYLTSLAGDAPTFGAVNTVVTATRTGYNTDGLGFMQMLEAEGVEVKDKKILLLGAGGAGRSVAKKLLDAGADLYLYNRTREKAEAVAKEFGNITVVDEVLPEERYAIINATGVGMHATVGVSPVSSDVLAQCEAAVDLIYEPKTSEFLRIASSLGKKTVNGLAMLFYQAYYADCYFFGIKPDGALAAKLFNDYKKENVL